MKFDFAYGKHEKTEEARGKRDDSRAVEKLTAIIELVIRRAPQLLGTFGYTPTPTP